MTAALSKPIGAVAHYTLLERLESTGPGELYRARDTVRGRTVAVRLLPADFAAEPATRTHLLDAARALLTLSHPNVTTLFDAGEHEGRIFLAFEFLRGQSLRAEMAGRPMNVRRAVEIAMRIAASLLRPALCGVRITLGSANSGWSSGGGSCSTTLCTLPTVCLRPRPSADARAAPRGADRPPSRRPCGRGARRPARSPLFRTACGLLGPLLVLQPADRVGQLVEVAAEAGPGDFADVEAL